MKPIDADQILNYCADACDSSAGANFFVEFMACIDEMPALDVVPVVRCKNCKHHRAWGYPGLLCYKDPITIHIVDNEFFCANGEKIDVE